jgi:N-acetylmuramoyl-L-alanine amidase
MSNIYLSPSNQNHNIGFGNYGTEQDEMHKVGEAVKDILERCNETCYISHKSMTFQQAVEESNKLKCDIHIAIHSNAFNKAVRGTQSMYVSDSGFKLSNAIYKRLEAFTPTLDRGCRQNDNLYELNHTVATAAYLELMFHDNKEDATLIMNNIEKLAEIIARGICEYLKVPFVEKKIVKEVDKDNIDVIAPAGHYYKIQVGAFSHKSYADAEAARLKALGIKNIVTLD